MFHTSYAIYASCGYPNGFNWALILYDVSHIALFSNFYYHTYTKKARERAQARKLKDATSTNGCATNGGVIGVEANGVVANGLTKTRLRSGH
jgi:hypothetical protein